MSEKQTASRTGMYRRCVIVGGAPIRDYERIKGLLKPEDFLIYCDCGLLHEAGLLRRPDLVVGDFDSHRRPDIPSEVITLPVKKDDTDTVYAAKEALGRGFESFLLLGMTGGRFDHSLGNLGLLLMLDGLHKRAVLADDYSEMEIISDRICEVDASCRYFSLIAIDGPADGVTISGAEYEMTDGSFRMDYSCLGVSNEVRKGEKAEIRVTRGRLLLVRVFKDSDGSG